MMSSGQGTDQQDPVEGASTEAGAEATAEATCTCVFEPGYDAGDRVWRYNYECAIPFAQHSLWTVFFQTVYELKQDWADADNVHLDLQTYRVCVDKGCCCLTDPFPLCAHAILSCSVDILTSCACSQPTRPFWPDLEQSGDESSGTRSEGAVANIFG